MELKQQIIIPTKKVGAIIIATKKIIPHFIAAIMVNHTKYELPEKLPVYI